MDQGTSCACSGLRVGHDMRAMTRLAWPLANLTMPPTCINGKDGRKLYSSMAANKADCME